MRQAGVDDGIKNGQTRSDLTEPVQSRRDKHRLEKEDEILRSAAARFAPGGEGRYVRGDIEDPHLTSALLDVNDDDPECGYRRVASELQWAVLTFGFVRIQG